MKSIEVSTLVNRNTFFAALIAFGVGALLVSKSSASRSRRSRMVEPVMRAASTLAREMFR